LGGPGTSSRPPTFRAAGLAAARLAAALLAVALLVAACGSSGTSGTPAQARTGQPAPGISGTALDGSAVDLAAYRGKPVIVNFWASWCAPCRDEFPLFKERLAALGATDGLVILGVLFKDEPSLAQTFLADFGATWPTLTDRDEAIATAYRVVAPPQTFFIDRDGVVRAIQVGQVRPADFDTQYAKIRPS
jgi:cytochrome c biogenesis protein CcmG/thiol:disulfide interchange protein DsbE